VDPPDLAAASHRFVLHFLQAVSGQEDLLIELAAQAAGRSSAAS
jgi:hypothetical protein